jgi:hypothetical protein
MTASTAGRATGACGWEAMTVAAHRFRRLVLPQSAMGRVGTSLLPASMPRTSTRELHDYSSCWLSTQGPSAKKRTMMIAAYTPRQQSPSNECCCHYTDSRTAWYSRSLQPPATLTVIVEQCQPMAGQAATRQFDPLALARFHPCHSRTARLAANPQRQSGVPRRSIQSRCPRSA